VDHLPNGTDGVLFLADPLGAPIRSAPTNAGLFDRTFLKFANFDETQTTVPVKDLRVIYKYWILCLFFPQILPTKPLKLNVGPKGSGKTTEDRKVQQFLRGPEANVTSLRDDEKDFETVLIHSHFVALDNVDRPLKWLQDALAKAATGEAIQRRELYTTAELATYQVNCFLSLTSREPRFKRDDVVDRLLIFPFRRLKKFTPEAKILAKIQQDRGELWGELLDILNAVLRALPTAPEYDLPFRMADFASFAFGAAGAFDERDRVVRILNQLSTAQDRFLTQDDPLVELLNGWLEAEHHRHEAESLYIDGAIELGATELFQRLSRFAEDRGGIPYKSARSMGHHLTTIGPSLSIVGIEMEKTHRNSGATYTFRLAEPGARG